MMERLGEFQIKKKLGEGGMGAVYLAYQESLEREVALKVLTERLCRSEKYIVRFKREARSAAAIVHPNVIQIYAIGEDSGIHYFAMEYVRGQDLATALAGGRRFSVAETLDIVMQTAEACACAAEVGIIHRDLKPANIMLTERGLVKVTDFGLAKPLQSDLDVTEDGIIVGTANYMSPEQGQGKPLDVRADIYSLGVVFFELLANRLPFVADQPAAVLYMHVYETPAPPSRFNPEVSPAVDRMVARMMAKNPEDRPRDAEALLAELRGLRQSLGGSALGWEPLSVRPMAQRKAESSAILPAVKSGGEAAVRLLPPGALKALVVDDLASVRKLYATVLTELGFSVSEAGDGENAINIWQKESPALVILDLNLPRLDGMSVLERRRQLPAAEVIVISGRKDRESVERVAAAGISIYLGKPVNLEELRTRISQAMSTAATALTLSKVDTHNLLPAAARSGRSILVCDRGLYARSLYQGVIESLGHCAAFAESLAEARDILAAEAADVLVMAISRAEEDGLKLVAESCRRTPPLPVVAIAEEDDETTAAQLRADGAAVLVKPVRIAEFRATLENALTRAPAATAMPAVFSQLAAKAAVREQFYTVFDFGRELAALLPAGSRASFENRLQEGTAREVQAAIANLLRRLKADGKADIAMRYVKYAYARGNFEVRNLCLALLSDILDRQEEISSLLKIVTDEDYRIRCRALERLGEIQAEEGIGIIVRFLNDDVWKVRKAAAACLERFDLEKTLEALVIFYSRAPQAFPDDLRRRLLAEANAAIVNLLVDIARRGGTAVRAFIAYLLGEIRSRLAVGCLLTLLRDKDSGVRAAAAHAAGNIQNDRLREALLEALGDANSEVQAAAISAIRQWPLTPEASVFLAALASRGKRISPEAVQFFQALNHRPGALALMLDKLERQSESNRRHLSLLLSYLFPDPAALESVIRNLGSAAKAEALAKIETAVQGAHVRVNHAAAVKAGG